jgi:hypothetical protein
MRTRLVSACILSAWLAALASAQSTPSTPSFLPSPQMPPAIELPRPTLPAAVIDVEERPDSVTPVKPAVQPLPASAPVTGLLVKTGLIPPTPEPAPPVVKLDAPPAPPMGRFWMDNEVLFWWIQGTRLPQLVSISPSGVAPVTSIYGPGSQDNNMRLGYRLTVGGFLDDERRFALEANFMMTANGGNQFNAFSSGDPVLARPVQNALTGELVAEPIAVPGVANGSIHIATRTTGILGAGIWLRENFTRTDDPCDTCHHCAGGGCNGHGCGGDPGAKWYCRFDSLFGYRYLRLSDNLEIDDLINAVVALNGVPAGSTLQRSDQFHTSNTFHGIDMGMTGEANRGPWTIAATAKVAVGFNDSSVDIFGARMLDGVLSRGGLLAQPTNIGHYSHVLASAVPELDLKLGYSFTPSMRLFVGYSFLYWYHVARSANQVNQFVDPTFLTNATPLGGFPVQPRPQFEDRSIWMQGLTLGFEWRY